MFAASHVRSSSRKARACGVRSRSIEGVYGRRARAVNGWPRAGAERSAAWPEEPERARVAVEKRGPLHRPHLAVAEETRERHVAQMAPESGAVVIGLAVEMLAAAQAGEQKRSVRPPPVAPEQLVEVGGRGPRVTQVELDDHAVMDQRAHDQRAVLAVDAHDVADQE